MLGGMCIRCGWVGGGVGGWGGGGGGGVNERDCDRKCGVHRKESEPISNQRYVNAVSHFPSSFLISLSLHLG